jgi:peroxiredoxin
MKAARILIGAILGLSLITTAVPAEDNPIAVGKQLPDFTLPAPEDTAHQAYLGLSAAEPFKISQIKAKVVIIEIFSMYCPHCQREAPTVNAFYEKIEKNPAYKSNVKLIGIGAGNSAFEIDFFKKKYAVPFPLFPDGDFSIHKKTGEVRTPYFIGIKNENGTATIYYSQLGGPEDSRQFLDKLLKRSGL